MAMPEQNRITQIIPCEDWFYIGPGMYGDEVYLRLAAWGLLGSGEVVGLVPERSDTLRSPQFARLIPAPRSTDPGEYIHLNNLTTEQRLNLSLAAQLP